MKRTVSGFTLPELMVVIVLITVVAGIALPNLSIILKKGAVETQAQRIISSIHLARSEAARLNNTVTICRSTDGSSCSGSSNWQEGWLIFVDEDADGAFDPDDSDPTTVDDEVLRFIDSADTNFTITTNSITSYVTFRPTGDANTAGRFVICPATGETSYGREVILSAVGRPRLHKGLTSDCSAS